jgi:hypothetical protein
VLVHSRSLLKLHLRPKDTDKKGKRRKLRWAYPIEEVEFFENDPNERKHHGVEGLDRDAHQHYDQQDDDSREGEDGEDESQFSKEDSYEEESLRDAEADSDPGTDSGRSAVPDSKDRNRALQSSAPVKTASGTRRRPNAHRDLSETAGADVTGTGGTRA